MRTQKFRLVGDDGREVEFQTPATSVFPYAAMRELARDNKLVNYRIEVVK